MPRFSKTPKRRTLFSEICVLFFLFLFGLLFVGYLLWGVHLALKAQGLLTEIYLSTEASARFSGNEIAELRCASLAWMEFLPMVALVCVTIGARVVILCAQMAFFGEFPQKMSLRQIFSTLPEHCRARFEGYRKGCVFSLVLTAVFEAGFFYYGGHEQYVPTAICTALCTLSIIAFGALWQAWLLVKANASCFVSFDDTCPAEDSGFPMSKTR